MKTSPSPKPKHWLLAKSRQWHTWGGLAAGIFLLVVGASGVVLNYKQPIFSALGLEKQVPKQDKSKPETKQPKIEFSTAIGFAALPVSMERALEIARAEWGNVPLERIEMKHERGEMLYKLKQKNGCELWINAVTGMHLSKGEYERIGKAGPDGVQARSTDWGKILVDLHTGKIGGDVGKAIMSTAALLLILLTVSGIYMWVKPLLIRRRNAKEKARVVKPLVMSAPAPAPARSGGLIKA